MTTPRSINRSVDAVAALAPGSAREAIADAIDSSAANISVAPALFEDLDRRPMLRLASNLAARLYPRIGLSAGLVTTELAELIRSINPGCDVVEGVVPNAPTLDIGGTNPRHDSVLVNASGWTVHLDSTAGSDSPASCAMLAAAAIGCGELFRLAFAMLLGGRSRREPAPWSWDILDRPAGASEVPTDLAGLDIGTAHLGGAGAIGQAVLLTLAESGARGTLVVVDHECITQSNLQRYVLTTDSDEGRAKVDVARDAMRASSLAMDGVATRWGADLRSGPGAETVLTAFDSPDMRVAAQAGLPRRLFNAWTQPDDLGWSRHERFGEEPCGACLYIPQGARPGDHELIAEAIKDHPLRVLGYLVGDVTVDKPLAGLPVIAGMTLPVDSERWLSVPILEDLIDRFQLEGDAGERWAGKTIGSLYRDGICAGALVVAGRGHHVVVPVAHQSALAGILMASELLAASHPDLARRRSSFVDHRLDVMAGYPQATGVPRMPDDRCICRDSVYVEAYREKWGDTAAP